MNTYEPALTDVNQVQASCPRATLLRIREALCEHNGCVEAAITSLTANEKSKSRKGKGKGKPQVDVQKRDGYQDLRQALWSGAATAGAGKSAFLEHLSILNKERQHRALVQCTYKACVEMFPDVSRNYLHDLLWQLPVTGGDQTNAALDILSRGEYPLQHADKNKDTSSSNRSTSASTVAPKIDWETAILGNKTELYVENARAQLLHDFPESQMSVVESQMKAHHMQYCQTHMALALSNGGRALSPASIAVYDPLFWWEREYVIEKFNPKTTCGCCFDDIVVTQVVLCTKGHEFCGECIRRATLEHVFANRKLSPVECLEMGGCDGCIPESSIKTCMPADTHVALEKIQMDVSLEMASIPNFATCPYCDYGVILEDSNTRLFRCGRKSCRAITCRDCRSRAHNPLTCDEAKSMVSGLNAVAEAQTAALLRHCPKCGKACLKDGGCNKITCVCRETFCYVCRQKVTGYDHFGESRGLCPLFDDTNARHLAEVNEAGQAAAKQLGLKGELAALVGVTRSDFDNQRQAAHNGDEDEDEDEFW